MIKPKPNATVCVLCRAGSCSDFLSALLCYLHAMTHIICRKRHTPLSSLGSTRPSCPHQLSETLTFCFSSAVSRLYVCVFVVFIQFFLFVPPLLRAAETTGSGGVRQEVVSKALGRTISRLSNV